MSPDQMALCGIRIISSPVAVEVSVKYIVTRWATRDKKRKNWRVMRVETTKPAILKMPGFVVMHPTLYAALKKAVPA